MNEPSRSRRTSPVEKYLGAQALEMGPLGLLGLQPDECRDERIVLSLEWQLDRVSQHPEGDTPEADEVRLALHAAAAQLLDKNVRRQVLSRLGVRADDAPEATGTSTRSLAALEQDAILTLAMHGGWNQKSLQRLAALAHARGMSSADLARSLQQLASKRRKPSPRAAASARVAPGAPRPVDSGTRESEEAIDRWEDAQARRQIRNFVLGIGSALVVLVSLAAYLVMLVIDATSAPPVATAPPPPGTATGPGPVAVVPNAATPSDVSAPAPRPAVTATPANPAPAASTPKPTAAASDEAYVDPQVVVRGLRDAASRVRTDPQTAMRDYLGALSTLMKRWCRFDPQQRQAADAAVIDYLFAAASDPALADAAMQPILDAGTKIPPVVPEVSGSAAAARPDEHVMAPDDVWPGVWSIGLLTRLSRERELPKAMTSAVEVALTSAIGAERPRVQAQFESGAVPSLRRIPVPLVRWYTRGASSNSTSGPLGVWVEAVSAVSGLDANLRERLLAEGLESILLHSAEPDADKHVFAAIAQLAVEIKWRTGGPARSRLLAWFKDPRVSTIDLHALSSAIANRSSAEGVDPMMVLSLGASAADRERLRGQYVKAWGESGAGPAGEASLKWIEAAREEIVRVDALSSEVEWLESAARLAELNDAATRLWRGDVDRAAAMIEQAGVAADDARQRAAGAVSIAKADTNENDGRWLASYLSVGRSIPERLQRLRELDEMMDPIGRADAELLVELGCLETPAEVRAAAQRIVVKNGSSPLVVAGLLEILPRAPHYSTVSTMIERVVQRSLPKPLDPAWEFEARRALVERLLELLSATGEQAAINDLAGLIWESYAARAGLGAPSPGEREGESEELGSARGVEASGAMWRLWRDSAEGMTPIAGAAVSLDTIDRRHEGRLALASGPIQRFAADQVSIAEVMAYVIGAENPTRASAVAGVVDEMSTQRRKSRHVFEQLVWAERAMLRLWLVRNEVNP